MPGDTAITSEVKAKLLADDIVPSRNVKVETNAGAVHLTGTVASRGAGGVVPQRLRKRSPV